MTQQSYPRILVRLGHKVDVVLQNLGVEAGGLRAGVDRQAKVVLQMEAVACATQWLNMARHSGLDFAAAKRGNAATFTQKYGALPFPGCAGR